MRRKPYTERGLRRMECASCGEKSTSQWSACALDGKFFPLCTRCDVELNEVAVRYVFGERWDIELKAYREKKIPQLELPLEIKSIPPQTFVAVPGGSLTALADVQAGLPRIRSSRPG